MSDDGWYMMVMMGWMELGCWNGGWLAGWMDGWGLGGGRWLGGFKMVGIRAAVAATGVVRRKRGVGARRGQRLFFRLVVFGFRRIALLLFVFDLNVWL